MIALDAVVAGEVALQRREDGDAKLFPAFVHVGEEVLDVLPVGFAAFDEEPVLDERQQRFALALVRRRESGLARPIEQLHHVLADDELRVRERVQQKHVGAILERHAHVEHGGLHRRSQTAAVNSVEVCAGYSTHPASGQKVQPIFLRCFP